MSGLTVTSRIFVGHAGRASIYVEREATLTKSLDRIDQRWTRAIIVEVDRTDVLRYDPDEVPGLIDTLTEATETANAVPDITYGESSEAKP